MNFLKLIFIFIMFFVNLSFSQETKKKCRINSNKQILDFIKKELIPFKKGTNDEGPRLSNADIKQLEIKHFSEQLKDSREMRMDILSFATLNQNDFVSLNLKDLWKIPLQKYPNYPPQYLVNLKIYT